LSETEYYIEICEYLKEEIENRLSRLGEFITDFMPCGSKDLSSGLKSILKSEKIIDPNLEAKVKFTRGLFVDILGLVYSKTKKKGELIICEVKPHNLTLAHLTQLIGYCIASNVKYGLLISIDKQITSGFETILKQAPLVKIERRSTTHYFAICTWKTTLKELYFDEIGAFNSLLALSRHIASSIIRNPLVD